jgi:hypothetical protein
MLRLSRPAKGNALNDAMIAGIESFFGDPPDELLLTCRPCRA